MDELDIIVLVIRVVLSLIIGFITWRTASKKNIGGGSWFVCGFLINFFFGLPVGALPIIMLALYPKNLSEEEKAEMLAKAEDSYLKTRVK